GLVKSLHASTICGVPPISAFLTSPITYAVLAAALSATVALYLINAWLNSRFLNNATVAAFDWDREIVVVTGGAGGIGGKTVLQLAKNRGTRVVVLDIIGLTYEKPDNVFYYRCDLTKYDELQAVAAQIRNDVGNPTVIVANAGICRGKSLLVAEPRDIQMTFGVNVIGLIWTIKTFLPHLVATNHGHILIMSSQTAFHTTAGGTDYSASKAATVSIYEGLHTELKHTYGARAVRVSVLKPSHVQTEMFKGIQSVPGMASITADALAQRVVQVLYSGRSQDLFVPQMMSFSTVIRSLPQWCRVLLQDMTASAFVNLDPHDPTTKS
ncbi:hypothetical protein TD95_005020, partial [Thielaviopsis punctulata]